MIWLTQQGRQIERLTKYLIRCRKKLDVLKGKFAVTGVELGNFIVTASTPFVDALNANYDDYILYFKNLFNATKTTLNALIQLWTPWATKVSKIATVFLLAL